MAGQRQHDSAADEWDAIESGDFIINDQLRHGVHLYGPSWPITGPWPFVLDDELRSTLERERLSLSDNFFGPSRCALSKQPTFNCNGSRTSAPDPVQLIMFRKLWKCIVWKCSAFSFLPSFQTNGDPENAAEIDNTPHPSWTTQKEDQETYPKLSRFTQQKVQETVEKPDDEKTPPSDLTSSTPSDLPFELPCEQRSELSPYRPLTPPSSPAQIWATQPPENALQESMLQLLDLLSPFSPPPVMCTHQDMDVLDLDELFSSLM